MTVPTSLDTGARLNNLDAIAAPHGASLVRAAPTPKVLVVGIVPSLTWTVTRSLVLAGMQPLVLGWQPVSPLQLAPRCQYFQWRNVRWIDGDLDPALVAQIDEVCREHAVETVVAADYPTGLLLSEHGAAIHHARVAPLPEANLMRTLNDKWRFSKILDRLGLPQPRTELALDRQALLDTQLAFPIITKPVDRWASVGFQIHRTPEELQRRIAAGELAADFPLLVQEFIPGRDVGFAFVASHGRLLHCTAFEQTARGVRRYFNAACVRDQVAQLLRETGYHGVGEIDLRYDPSRDEYRFLEVNPRFWASALYATRAGMNFPKLLLDSEGPNRTPEFHADSRPARLTPYELGMARGALLVESATNTLLRGASHVKRLIDSVRGFDMGSVAP